MSESNGKTNGKGHYVKPDCWDPVLMCSGGCRRPTKHSFKMSVPMTEASRKNNISIYYQMFYECLTCKQERLYGIQSSD